MMEELEDLLNCPILLIPIQKPVILPSGHTVEEVVMQNFIEKRSFDTYDNSKMCENLVHNRFFSSLKELYESIKDKMGKVETIKVNQDLQDSIETIEFLQFDTQIELTENTQHTQENGTQ